jgi:hypothetical protein
MCTENHSDWPVSSAHVLKTIVHCSVISMYVRQTTHSRVFRRSLLNAECASSEIYRIIASNRASTLIITSCNKCKWLINKRILAMHTADTNSIKIRERRRNNCLITLKTATKMYST